MILAISLSTLATLASIELVRASGLFAAFRALSAHGHRSARLLARTGVSEWAKERGLLLASSRMFSLSFRAGGRLALVAAPLVLLTLADRMRPFDLVSA
jgi:hypothetical protein